MQTQTYTIDIRPRRQATLPRELLERLGVDVGDKLEAKVSKKSIVLRSNKQVFTDAFNEIRRIVKESGVTEEEMQKSVEITRKELYEKNFGSKSFS